MKSLLTKSCTLIMLILIGFIGTAQDRIIAANQLPKPIVDYLKTHFPNNAILHASVYDHVVYKKYEVDLKDNISLEFNRKYKVTEIKSKSKLPDSVIPSPILQYVKVNFSKNFITEWQIDDGKQKVELDNGIDLEFNLQGKFLRIDR